MSLRAKDKLPDHGGEASRSEPQAHNHWVCTAVCLYLAVSVWVVFGQTLHHDFVNYDDNVYVYKNPAISRGLDVRGVVWAFTHRYADNWHPLTALTHMADCQIYGLKAGGHHLTNVLIHAATAILLFLVLRAMTGAFWRAAFVAAVFAIHPLRAESVAWVSERKDVLSGMFFMLTLWAYARYVQKSGARSQEQDGLSPFSFLLSSAYWLALVLFACDLMSKPMVVTVPFVLLLLDYWPLKRFTIHQSPSTIARLVMEKIPFLLLTVASCLTTIWAQENAVRCFEEVTLPVRVGNALVAYTTYLWQLLCPVGLAVFYPHPENRLSGWQIGLSVVVLGAISAGVVAGQRKRPYLLMGWLWYLGMLVPVIGVMQVGVLAHADRYTYLPQIGLVVLVTWGAVDLCGTLRHRRAALGAVALAMLMGLAACAHVQTGYWKDSISLWRHALACTSGNYIAHNNLGEALVAQGDWKEATQHFEQALQIKSDYVNPHLNLGAALANEGKWPEAFQHLEHALRLDPDNAKVHNNLGVALVTQGNLGEAMPHYERALQLDPDYTKAHYNLGIALARLGKLTEAIQHFERAIELSPAYAEAHYGLGQALVAQGKPEQGIAHFQQALELAKAQNNPALAEVIRDRLRSCQSALSRPQTP